MDASSADLPAPGTITKLTVQKNDPDRVSVFIDGAFAFGVHQDLVLKHQLRTGRVLTPDDRAEIEAEDARIKAKQRALDYLAHKPRTEHEVRRKLQQNEVPDATIDTVVARLTERGYLDDAEYAAMYVRRRFASKGYGPVRIQQELTQKRGVDRHLAETAVDDFFDGAAVLAAAREHAEKKWVRLRREEDPRKRRDKLYRYLKRRGYTYDTIRRVLDEMEARGAA